MLKWPDAGTVKNAARAWALDLAKGRPEIIRIGYFGSYAQGDWGVGSDLDLVMVLDHDERPFERRASAWDTTTLPVPADLLVYTLTEWERLDPGARFSSVLKEGTVWIYERDRGLQ